jgi:phosphatidylserine/phosphatidylglycerophosphate/cardiolipin synthase-like enzyme
MRIINGYDNLHTQLVDLIDECDDTFFLCSFNFCLEYDKRVKEALMNALHRNVRVYILTTGINKYCVDINHKNCTVFNQVNIRRQQEEHVKALKQLFNVNIGNDYNFVNHMRFCYNGHELLLGGTNVSPRYNGNHFELIENHNFTWYDSGLLMKCPKQKNFFHRLFHVIAKDEIPNLNPLFVYNGTRFTTSNTLQYNYILEQINKSKHSIYIENQYLHSCRECNNNLIFETLAKRINKAIMSNSKFHVTIVANYYNYDEGEFEQNILNCVTQQTLLQFRDCVQCSAHLFDKYVTIYCPTEESKIVVHSKAFVFDEKRALYTTCNISDRSFYTYGDVECGAIIENKKQVRDIMLQLTNDFNMSRHLFYKFDYSNIDYIRLYATRSLYYTIDAAYYPMFCKNIVELSGLKLPIHQ